MSVSRAFCPEQVVLANGMRVLMVENSTTPSVALSLVVLAGSRDEVETQAGTAMMVSRLLEEGTRSRSSLDIAQAIESVGGEIDTDCSFDRMAVFLSVLKKDIDLGLDLVGDMIRNPVFSEASIENERERTLAEIRSAMDRPQVVAGWEFNELIYREHALHRPVHGYPETIQRLRRHDLSEFHERYVTPDNSILAVTGDFDIQEMKDRLESRFGSWAPAPARSVNSRKPPERTVGANSRHLSLESQQSHIYFGHLGIERRHPDFYTLQVMDTILGAGAGLTARIPRKLRDEQGLAYTTFASISNSAGTDPGKFLAYIGTAPENVDRALRGFMEEIDQVRSHVVSATELADAKAYLTGSFVFGFETNAQVTRFLINAALYDLGFDYVAKYPALVEAVSAEGIREAAAAHLSTEDYVLVVAGPEAGPQGPPFEDGLSARTVS